jgi:glycosyltransferase A (GT-A) superfamily protein (DUF2064 family)
VDGGFYLLGLRGRVTPLLFQDVPWSTSAVHGAVCDNATAAGLALAPYDTLRTLPDVDTVADLEAWARTCRSGHALARVAQETLESATD